MMVMAFDLERKVTVDTDTGNYMVYTPTHWQDPYLHFAIYSSDDRPIFGADVERDAIDETGQGGATLVRFIVRHVWFPSGKPEKPTYFWGETEFVDKLGDFITFWAKGTKPLNPQPRYEFVDGRSVQGES